MNKLKVSFLFFSLLAMSVPVKTANMAISNQLVKLDGNPAVYLIEEDGKRYVYPNEDVYFSWYSDFSEVKTITALEMANYPIGSNLTIRPGTKLVKIATDPKVYVVEMDCYLRHIPDEETAKKLYGPDWAKRVVDVPDSFFMNYNVGSQPISATSYPRNSLIQKEGSDNIYYINSDDRARKFASQSAFIANGFNYENVITVSADYSPSVSTEDITAQEEALRYPKATCFYER
jgi:hypothetical protein